MEIETVRLVRQASTPQGTPGRIYPGEYSFDTLEPPAPHHRPDHPRVPAGKYLCKQVGTRKFPGRYVLQQVPGRSGIVMHPGNWAGDPAQGYQSDTDGCILLGYKATLLNTHGKQQIAVCLSRSTHAAFDKIMGNEDFFLHIYDPTDG